LLCNDPQNAFSNPLCANYRYDHRNEWRKGLTGKPIILAPWDGQPQAKAWNELRHVMAGTTTVAGSGGQQGLVRNPDREELMEGLQTAEHKFVKFDTFPLGDNKQVDGHNLGDCQYPKVAAPSILLNLIFLPHVAEGINEFAWNEVFCLTGRGKGSVALQAPNSTFIHAIAANPQNAKVFSDSQMTMVWSPRSNLSLYGNTAAVTLYDNMDIPIALSTDWLPSGSITMQRELTCASDFNQHYLDNHFSQQELWKMATVNGARALGIADQVGILAKGYWADIAIYQSNSPINPNIYQSIIKGNVADVSLVLRAGKPLYGDQSLMQALDPSCETIPNNVCGVAKSACVKETGYSLNELFKYNQHSYPLFVCEPPADEPSCTPARYQQYNGRSTNTDTDGDGINNDSDNCPNIFNPLRPMDNGVQADYNNNGIGDACDTLPLH
jgi:hypothetical protein